MEYHSKKSLKRHRRADNKENGNELTAGLNAIDSSQSWQRSKRKNNRYRTESTGEQTSDQNSTPKKSRFSNEATGGSSSINSGETSDQNFQRKKGHNNDSQSEARLSSTNSTHTIQFSCQQCQLKFVSKTFLERHLDIQHQGHNNKHNEAGPSSMPSHNNYKRKKTRNFDNKSKPGQSPMDQSAKSKKSRHSNDVTGVPSYGENSKTIIAHPAIPFNAYTTATSPEPSNSTRVSHQSETAEKFSCSVCRVEFHSKKSMKRHRRDHYNTDGNEAISNSLV